MIADQVSPDAPGSGMSSTSHAGLSIGRPVRSRARSAVLYFLSSQFLTAITMVVGLVSTPLMLMWLGPDRYGLIRVLTSWSGYVGILSTTMITASAIAIVPMLGVGATKKINVIVMAAAANLLLLAGVNMIVGLGASMALPWLAPAPSHLVNERWLAFVLLISTCWLAPFLLSRTLLEADQRGFHVNVALLGQFLCITSLSLAAAWLGWGLSGQAVATLFGMGFYVVLLLLLARHHYPWLVPQRASWVDLRTVWVATLGLLALGALGTVCSGIEQIAVNYFGGPSAVADYLLTQRLFTIGLGQVVGISSAVWAPLSDLYHRQEQVLLGSRVRECLQVICAISYALGLTLFAYDAHFVRLWVGANYYGGDGITLAFALTLPLAGMQAFYGWLLTATGHKRVFLPGMILYSTAMLVSGLLLGWRWGPGGVAWGVLLSGAGTLLWYNPWATHRALGLRWTDLCRPYLSATLLALPIGVVTSWWARMHIPYGWLGLAAEMTATGVAYLTLWWLIVIKPTERAGYIELGRVILKRSIG